MHGETKEKKKKLAKTPQPERNRENIGQEGRPSEEYSEKRGLRQADRHLKSKESSTRNKNL